MAELFPSRQADQVRIAQSVAAVRQHWGLFASMVNTMVAALIVQLLSDFNWAAALWQFYMGFLVFMATASWRRLHVLPPPQSVSQERIHRLTLFGALYGVGCAVGTVIWAGTQGPEFEMFIIALLLTQNAYAVAICYFSPAAVLAFHIPVCIGCAFSLSRTLPPWMAQLGILLIAGHLIATLGVLRRNWDHFVNMVGLDIEKGRLMEMLHQQKEVAERAGQLQSRFLAAASHDLRQPMHAISLYLGGLAELNLPGRGAIAVRDALECAHNMNEMFRSLLDMSRLDAQQSVPHLSVFPVDAILARVEKEFAPLARARNIRLSVRPSNGHVYSDPMMVERIILNFVSNALRYSLRGRVLVGCRRVGGILRFAVYDSGPGIPEDQQQAVFDEFFRLQQGRTPENAGGLGLGLAIVRRLAKTLRAAVVLKSKPGHGSMFAIDLPLMHAGTRFVRGKTPVESPLEGKLVVLVDDEASILQAASFILEKAGCVVVGARSGREALDSLETSERVPDAIICDYELNDMLNGPAVIQAVREEFNADIPALLVTGATGGGAAERFAREMRLPLLYKPLESAELRKSLGLLLSVEEQ